MLSKNAKHPICAYKYMNYVTSPATQAGRGRDRYSPANTKTCAVVGATRCNDLHITDAKTTTHQVLADAGAAHELLAVDGRLGHGQGLT
jgi:spermidine/putrescine-binding protein